MEKLTQHQKVMNYLKNHNGITTLDAMFHLSITDLQTIIKDARRNPKYVVTDIWETNTNTGSRYKRYFIKEVNN